MQADAEDDNCPKSFFLKNRKNRLPFWEILVIYSLYGRLAQLGERPLDVRKVMSSSLLPSIGSSGKILSGAFLKQ